MRVYECRGKPPPFAFEHAIMSPCHGGVGFVDVEYPFLGELVSSTVVLEGRANTTEMSIVEKLCLPVFVR